jgi:hypothetical protein
LLQQSEGDSSVVAPQQGAAASGSALQQHARSGRIHPHAKTTVAIPGN